MSKISVKKTDLLADVEAKILATGRYLNLIQRGRWEYIERNNCTGIVIIIAVTNDHKLILIEQYRIPVAKNVIEFPAGLVNDQNLKKKESLATAAKRELLEETGYRAQKMRKIISGPISSGSSADIVTIFKAENIHKRGAGGGDSSESIKVYEILLSEVEAWLMEKQRTGCLVDPKIYAGLYFLEKYNTATF